MNGFLQDLQPLMQVKLDPSTRVERNITKVMADFIIKCLLQILLQILNHILCHTTTKKLKKNNFFQLGGSNIDHLAGTTEARLLYIVPLKLDFSTKVSKLEF